ncbi:MAG: flagellin FliC3 [Lachnospiraceae bacterium]|nr:flagellin FliC3 [Lachnospiraceae bacterium]
MKINSNIQALVAQNVLRTNEEKHAQSTEKLSSGFKINHAKDSPAGMAISNRMNAQIRSLYKAKDNANNAVNVVQTADGALNEVHNMLQRMNELAVKASTGTLTSADRLAIHEEVNALRKEINRVASDTEYNTQNLLGGEQQMKGYCIDMPDTIKNIDYDVDFPKGVYELDHSANKITVNGNDFNFKSFDIDTENKRGTVTLDDGSKLAFSYTSDTVPSPFSIDVTGIGGMKIQVGSSSGQEIQVVIPKLDSKSMGIDDVDVRTQEGARKALDDIKDAIEYVSKARSGIGAYQNRLESTVASLSETVENLENSYSTVKDVDMAEEMVDYTKLQVLVQAGTSMLAQANEQPQQALQLLQ